MVTCVNTTLMNVPAHPAKTEPNVWMHQMLTCVNAQKVSCGVGWAEQREAHLVRLLDQVLSVTVNELKPGKKVRWDAKQVQLFSSTKHSF